MHDLLPELADKYISMDAAGHKRKPRGIPGREGLSRFCIGAETSSVKFHLRVATSIQR